MRVLEQGARLADRYTLVRRLGSGGMSEIWLARGRQTESPVALKFLAADLADKAGYRKRLREEWQLGSRLMHANIIRVFEFHDDAERPFYSLQYVGGTDVSVLTGEDLDVALRPIGFIADALRYAHGKSIVHRDIKASNVLLDQRGAPYLIDFGVAARADGATGGGSTIASSPQQLAGQPPRPEDDVYSLGVLIYELISGRPPFVSPVGGGKGSDPLPLEAKNGGAVPSSIVSVVTDMLDRDPGARPTAESVAQRLTQAGFSPGLVPARYLGTAVSVDDDSVEALEAIRPVRRRAAPQGVAMPESERPSGISPRVLGGALAGALLLFLAVVFLLPRFIGEGGGGDADRAAAPGQDGELREGEDDVLFNENLDEFVTRDERVLLRQETEAALGELLSKLETLEARAVGRWGGQSFKDAQEIYAEGDEAYLRRDYKTATEKYREAITIIDPLLDRVDEIFDETMSSGKAALEAGDSIEAVHHYELAVAISPGHAQAHNGLTRAKNLDLVMSLTHQGTAFEEQLDLDAARTAFEQALALDDQWQPAEEGLQRVLIAGNQMSFEQRMTEGLEALADGDFPAARAAFRTAQALQPDSREPADGLLQVDLGIKLERISALERDAKRFEQREQWGEAVEQYTAILEIDADLTFAHEGLARSAERSRLHQTLEEYIADPDRLSEPATMQAATKMLLDITRMPSIGPRLEDQKDQLSRLLKRAVTPLTVHLVSDNATDVVIFRVGKLGSFYTREISLRPGTYVAIGSRPGYRDVRIEFRVAPEIELQPVVVRSEEQI